MNSHELNFIADLIESQRHGGQPTEWSELLYVKLAWSTTDGFVG